MSFLKKAQGLQQMLAEGKMIEGFEKFYHDNVQVYEIATGEHRNGKEAQRQGIQKWVDMVDEVHAAGCDSITSDEDNGVTTAETWMDVSFKDGTRWKMREVAVQKWQDDQIIEEKFYYHMPS